MQIMKEGTIDKFIICCGIFRQTMQEVIDYKKNTCSLACEPNYVYVALVLA